MAAWALGEMPSSLGPHQDVLRQALSDPEPRVQDAARRALRRMEEAESR